VTSIGWRTAGVALGAVMLAGCGGQAAPQAPTTSAAPQTTIVPAPSISAVPQKYASPSDMVAKLKAARFELRFNQGEEQPTYNIYGALAVAGFHGAANETDYVGTFETRETAEELERGLTAVGTVIHHIQTDQGWYVTANSLATLRQAVDILSQ
jgi:hypothetical protein